MGIILALALPITAIAVAQVDQAALARSLQSAALSEQHAASQQILLIPPQQREEGLWLALVVELERVQDESHAPSDAIQRGLARTKCDSGEVESIQTRI
jgi:hypothetical protein